MKGKTGRGFRELSYEGDYLWEEEGQRYYYNDDLDKQGKGGRRGGWGRRMENGLKAVETVVEVACGGSSSSSSSDDDDDGGTDDGIAESPSLLENHPHGPTTHSTVVVVVVVVTPYYGCYPS